MATLWFCLVALMVAAYVVLDGFDLGAGVVHLFVARTDSERRLVIRAIGPVWDVNEVWLLAAGGTLYFAFPQLYASGFSGFYLPLMMVLWLLMLRAIGIEFRTHLESDVWRSFFDVVFSMSSLLLTIFLGAALGNVIRGVPLGQDGYFFEPLWTDWRVGPHPGILDWYTVMCGIIALVTLTAHGALYVANKTEGDLNARCRASASRLWPVQLLLTLVSLIATVWLRPELLSNYKTYPVGWLIPIVVIATLLGMFFFRVKGNDKAAFISSALYIAVMLVGAVFALYPTVLPASTNPAWSLTIYNSAAPQYGLKIGLVWWAIGMVFTVTYFVFVYRMFRGKVSLEHGSDHGY
jgi:cytochrome bd ubiquinol oxidase subunit II